MIMMSTTSLTTKAVTAGMMATNKSVHLPKLNALRVGILLRTLPELIPIMAGFKIQIIRVGTGVPATIKPGSVQSRLRLILKVVPNNALLSVAVTIPGNVTHPQLDVPPIHIILVVVIVIMGVPDKVNTEVNGVIATIKKSVIGITKNVAVVDVPVMQIVNHVER